MSMRRRLSAGLAVGAVALAACRAGPSPAATEIGSPAPPPAAAPLASPSSTAAVSRPAPTEPPPPDGSVSADTTAAGAPAPSPAAVGDFPLPAYCRAWVPLAEWADAYSNTGVPMRMRFVRATKLSARTWRVVFAVESSDSEVVHAFLGHFSLIPLAGAGDSHPGSLAAPLRAGQRGGVTLDFALEPTAQPALAFFEDDDFPLCFQVGPLEAGPQEGIHPLSRGMDAPRHFFLAATFAGFAGSAGFSGGFGSWMSS